MSETNEIVHIQADSRYSKATSWAGLGHISVQYPDREGEDVTGQTQEVLGKLEHYMERLGTDKSRLLKCTVFFADIGDFAAINQIWDAWVVPGRPPARTPVLCQMLRPDVKVAIEAMVAID